METPSTSPHFPAALALASHQAMATAPFAPLPISPLLAHTSHSTQRALPKPPSSCGLCVKSEPLILAFQALVAADRTPLSLAHPPRPNRADSESSPICLANPSHPSDVFGPCLLQEALPDPLWVSPPPATPCAAWFPLGSSLWLNMNGVGAGILSRMFPAALPAPSRGRTHE